jgi:outer membrane immunogenic protein
MWTDLKLVRRRLCVRCPASFFFFTFLGLLVFARPAQAADIAIDEVDTHTIIIQPSYIWTGYYFGMYGGGAWGHSNHDFPPATGDFSISGTVIGGTIGYNFQIASVVGGIEFDAGWANIKGSTINNCPGLSCDTQSSGLITLRGRLGYAFDRFLPFATGGIAFGEVNPNVVGIGTGTTYKTGFAAGAGAEFALTREWIARLEYLYINLGSYTCAACGIVAPDNVSFTANVVRIGLNYKID